MENLKYTEILKLNKAMVGKIDSNPYEIGILSNLTINSFKEILEYSCRHHGIEPNIEIGNFDNIVQDSSNFNRKDLVIIFYDILNIVDSVDVFIEDIDDVLLDELKNKMFTEIQIIFNNLIGATSVIFNSFSSAYFVPNYSVRTKIDKFVLELNRYLDEQKPGNVSIICIDKIYNQIGIKDAIDYRFYNSSKAPYTFSFFKKYLIGVESIIIRNTGKLKKAIILDCDNTLWKGVIGEDGIGGIDMSPTSIHGKFYHYVQQMIVYLSKRGVIVGLCSKNNEQDVMDVINSHKDMVLKKEHIVIYKINWQDKASNLIAIAAELNINIDSLVFIDDSSFEINLIKEQLPEVLTIQVPTNITDYPRQILNNIYKYFNLNVNSDDVKKTEMYKQQFHREKAKNSYDTIEDYLASLEIELKIIKNDPSYIPRISQLTQKTNQFNLTTKRYTESQIEEFMTGNNHFVYAMFVKDKFGDNGLTGACILKRDEADPENLIIDTFLMSCRVIGRNIEYAFLTSIVESVANNGYNKITADFFPTKKNMQVMCFYENAGLHLVQSINATKNYSINIANFEGKKVDYIKIKASSNE